MLEPAGGRPGKRKRLYDDHKTQTEITAGIKSGDFHQVQCPISLEFDGSEALKSPGCCCCCKGTHLQPSHGYPPALFTMP